MNFKQYPKITLFLVTICAFSIFSACKKSDSAVEPGKASSPTEAYKMLYTAVKSKDTDKIKSMMSKATVGFAEGVAAQQKKDIKEVYANGFTATTFAETLPEIRDERVKDEFGNVEVYNSRDNRWEDLAFVKEDGGWKLAVGDLFAGTFKSPGRSKAMLEAENSNTSGLVPLDPNINGNFSSGKQPSNSNVKTIEVQPESNKAAEAPKK